MWVYSDHHLTYYPNLIVVSESSLGTASCQLDADRISDSQGILLSA